MGIPPDEDLGGRSLPYVTVGDEAFPLQKFLMRPYPRSARRLNEDERILNYRLSRCRNTVENTFGILANTWRVYHRSLYCRVELADKIILATVVLHNYTRQLNIQTNLTTVEDQTNETNVFLTIRIGTSTNSSREALNVRNSFKEYLISHKGRVEWQQRVVNRTA